MTQTHTSCHTAVKGWDAPHLSKRIYWPELDDSKYINVHKWKSMTTNELSLLVHCEGAICRNIKRLFIVPSEMKKDAHLPSGGARTESSGLKVALDNVPSPQPSLGLGVI